MRLTKRILIALFIISSTPSFAHADWLFTPFAGQTFNGDAPDKRLNYGVGIGFMGAGIFGVEFDASSTPDFFGASEDFGDNNVTTVMVNLIAGAPGGGQMGPGFRPYATAGAGLIRSRVDGLEGFVTQVSSSDFGVNVGGGVMGFFSDHVGVRGDIRYFRSLNDLNEDFALNDALGDFDFWRWGAGVVVRW
jgi:hypothetical protein